MATITTLRPSATSSGVGWTAEPSGALEDVTSDDSDVTWAEWTGDGSPLIQPTPVDSPPAGERRHLVRLRARGEDGSAWWAVRLASGVLVAGAAGDFGSTPETLNGSWQAGAPTDGATVLAAYVTAESNAVKITELYLDVDSREAPTFTAQVLDGTGSVSTSIGDTNTPTLQAAAIDADGLTLRQYRYWVTLAGNTVWDTGIVSGSPAPRVTDPLDNGSYVANLQIWTTLGTNTAYPSDVETVAFDLAVGTIPAPATPTVTAAAPFYGIEVCAPDVDDFDGDEGWVEIQRIDCNGALTSVAILGPLATDACAEVVDYSLPRTGTSITCDHTPEPCCSTYRARTIGRVDGALLVSDWSAETAEFCLTYSDDYHLIRTTGPTGPLAVEVGGKFDWAVPRPFSSAIGVMGTRFVTSSSPGGRNLRFIGAVESEAELEELRAVLRRPLVLVSPSDAHEVWAVPIMESYRVTKAGRIRTVAVDFIATGPEPSPQLADVGT